jgi:hypothetical protein
VKLSLEADVAASNSSHLPVEVDSNTDDVDKEMEEKENLEKQKNKNLKLIDTNLVPLEAEATASNSGGSIVEVGGNVGDVVMEKKEKEIMHMETMKNLKLIDTALVPSEAEATASNSGGSTVEVGKKTVDMEIVDLCSPSNKNQKQASSKEENFVDVFKIYRDKRPLSNRTRSNIVSNKKWSSVLSSNITDVLSSDDDSSNEFKTPKRKKSQPFKSPLPCYRKKTMVLQGQSLGQNHRLIL